MHRQAPNHRARASAEAPDVLILCGGQGTRLRPVLSDRPKVLAPIGGEPFLSLLIRHVRAQGFPRIILCTGYKGDMVRKAFAHAVLPLIFSEETEPLGTGGAVKKALPLVSGSDLLILNGDTFCVASLANLSAFHREKRAMLSMVLTPSSRSDGGNITLNAEGRIVGFKEKQSLTGKSFLNAGVYAVQKEIVTYMPRTPAFSLEYDVFPRLIRSAPCFGFVTDEEAIDIGTPERYHEAARHFNKHPRRGAV